MRIAIVLPVLLLSACNVSKDDNGTTISYDQDAAENAVDTVADTAQNVGGEIVNDVKETGDQVENQVGDVDVKVDTDGNKAN